jgi:PAS domain S-box-containing protein
VREDRQLRASVAIGQEIEPGGSTQRQRHEQELAALERASAARYRQLADAMPQIVWTAAADGSATYFNRRWFEYTGMQPDEAGPNAWQLVVHPDDLANAVAVREASLRSGETFEVEYRLRARDGSYRWHLGRAVSLHDETGRIELWIGTATDIHDRKVIEEQLAQERAPESMRQDIVATVSHELRAPLAAIYGAALTLRRGDVELGTQLRNKLLDIVTDESSRLSEIVKDLLLASQLDSGKLRVNIEPCDPRKIASAEIDSARTHLPENVELVLKTPRSLPSIAVDAGQLRQVIANLIDNAIKYSPKGGRVTVTLGARDHQVRFAVNDPGLGVPAAEQERIFEKFYRLDPHLERGIGGTGLGLYICRELVRRVNGQIWVESDAGKGSTFFVEVPQQQPAYA